ncbi:MAG: Ig-like domain-containing protein, partial [Planctomycetota bacterium]
VDIIDDGLFLEADEPNSDRKAYQNGETFGDWEATGNGIDLRGSSWEDSPSGGRGIDLIGDKGFGGIQQTLQTVPGQTYELVFFMSGNFESKEGSMASHTMDVSVGGDVTGFEYDQPADWSRSNLQWERRTLTFTATSDATVLAFGATSGDLRGAMVSEIVVMPMGQGAIQHYEFSLEDDAEGRFTIDSATGEIKVADGTKLDYETDASHSLTVRMDSNGQTSFQTIDVNVEDVNEAPTVNDRNIGVFSQNKPTEIPLKKLMEGSTDPDGDAIEMVGFEQPAHGQLELNSDGFVYTPDGSYSGEDQFTYTISDSDGMQATATITFVVNDTPEAVDDDQFEVAQNGTLSGNVTDNDSDQIQPKATTVYETVSDVQNGSLKFDPSTGEFSYTPDPGFFGEDTFQYQINDNRDVSEIATVTIRVMAPPVATQTEPMSVEVGGSAQIGISDLGIDPDGKLSLESNVELVDGPDSGRLELSKTDDGRAVVNYISLDPDALEDSFQYRLRDADGLLSEILTFKINIEHAPEVTSVELNPVLENSDVGTVVGQVSASDLNQDIVTFEFLDDDGDPTNNPFRVDPTTGVITVNSATLLDFESTKSFEETIVVTDEFGLTTTRNVTINVSDVNESVILTESNRSLDEGALLRGDLTTIAEDPEAEDLRFELVDQPEHGALDLKENGTWDYQHDNTENFSDSFTYRVIDSAGNITESTVNLNIAAIDDQPIANSRTFEVNDVECYKIARSELLGENQSVSDRATIEIITNPEGGKFSINEAGELFYEPTDRMSVATFLEYRVIVDDQVSEVARIDFVLTGFTRNENSVNNNNTVPEVVESEPEPVIEEISTITIDEPTTEPEPEIEIEPEIETETVEETINQNNLLLGGQVPTNGVDETELTLEEEQEQLELELAADQDQQSSAESQAEQQRSLLWQPRYGVLGNQVYAEASLNNLATENQYLFEQELLEFSGINAGMSEQFL